MTADFPITYHDIPAWAEWDALLAAYPTPAHVTADTPLSADEREALALYFALQVPPGKPQAREAEKEALRQALAAEATRRELITETMPMVQPLSSGRKVRSTDVPTGRTGADTPVSRSSILAQSLTPDLPIQTRSSVVFSPFQWFLILLLAGPFCLVLAALTKAK